MDWYWILLIVIGYIIMMILTAVLLNRYSSMEDKEECILAGVVWPFVICFFIIAIPIGTILYIIGKLADKWEEWEKRSKH